jgi:ankyrin repeat protein
MRLEVYYDGRTALFAAAEAGHVKIVEILLEMVQISLRLRAKSI